MSKELEHIRRVNQSVEHLINTVDKVQHDLSRTGGSSKNANKLLEMWIKILSQTQHTADLLNNSMWQGNAATAEHIREFEKEKEQRRLREEEEKKRRMLELERLRKNTGSGSGSGRQATRLRRPMPTSSVDGTRTRIGTRIGTGTVGARTAGTRPTGARSLAKPS